ncbi:hypothetical protein F5Y18DRAFT_107560 [Xylariaceae sp. FL1019]|nr:hypothetical protein F5Y18DRAFT_107560 [Xylariaceae sp. FL1019]
MSHMSQILVAWPVNSPVPHGANRAKDPGTIARVMPTSPVDAGSDGPSTASQDPSLASPPHPTCGEAAQLAPAIIDKQAAVVDPSPTPVLKASTVVTGNTAVTHPKMLFSEFYKSTKLPLPRLRQPQQQPHSPSVSDPRQYDPDLVSKDRNKQKEAVKRFLASNIRNDWVFKWPLTPETNGPGSTATEENSDAPDETLRSNEPAPEATDAREDASEKENAQNGDSYGEDDDASTYSIISEDQDNFAPRLEWLSDWSDDDDEVDEPVSPSAYRFESPDAIASTVKASQLARSAKHRRAVRAEMEWNTGLACFNARRDAWTGARTARIRPKATTTSTVSSPTTGRRLSFWKLSTSATPASPIDPAHNPTAPSPTATRTSGDTTAISSSDKCFNESRIKEESSRYPIQTILPTPPPLLPPTNPMRASITAATYSAIYDKIVLEALMPACPVNLRDVLCSCVVGWKRDGEWPPKAMEVNPVVAVRSKKKKKDINTTTSRRLSFNLLGRRLSAGGDVGSASKQPQSPKDDGVNANGVKRSLSKVLRLGQDKPNTNGIAA